MIKNIIFDFGDIFINLDKQAPLKELAKLGVPGISDQMMEVCNQYEQGLLSTAEFVDFFNMEFKVSKSNLINAWNSILRDLPKHRLDFIKELSNNKKYRLFLLSNTNDLHISWIQNNWGKELYNEFKKCFEQFYLSHEINMRKPNADIFHFVLKENNLKIEETIFIDDTKENTDTAKALGMPIWNLNPKTEDVVNLFTRKEFKL
ncbi:putative hydrolase of the HAD superfamily [Lutibacter sp. Hel_I_33_5]|uniref:HAD-IA family hydrolase n=1 Tax=Lutibacter sp. Hel_I_33_5 TaxID=1566289 RepID=UPI0011A9FD3D|nr:HAD-IA family hydrolase [Lutibacter sp. Hel_I_33_5]TVZ55200.1 putative hydrolase of the HAD superfamily [Lutibacter sp. Hel_I_33_5]